MMRDFWQFWHATLCNFVFSRHVRIQDWVANPSKAIKALYSPCILWNINCFTSSFVENFKPLFQCSGKSTLWFLQFGKFKLYFPHGGKKYSQSISILSKLSAFFSTKLIWLLNWGSFGLINLLLTKLSGSNFLGALIFVDQTSFDPSIFWTNSFCTNFFF